MKGNSSFLVDSMSFSAFTEIRNSKAADFATYSLPKVSVMNWEDDQRASSKRSGCSICHRNESRNGNDTDLSIKPKAELKIPCFDVAKTMVARKYFRGPGT